MQQNLNFPPLVSTITSRLKDLFEHQPLHEEGPGSRAATPVLCARRLSNQPRETSLRGRDESQHCGFHREHRR
ncbi:hypothetical protein GQ600_18374 [Phytophthora cactorum]|nr:hypothetical protein GQ600_18374 [Phytophthora cactorum]